ncbi:MAG TPA: DUF4184 family protein, partial [Streptomyces sp.]|nr:DUF4184 family protein [Streptomyces sp.]
DRWGVRWITVLDERVLGVPLYHLLQYGGSALALVVLAAFLARAWHRTPDSPLPVAGPGETPVVPGLSARGRAWAVALLCGAVLAGAVHRCARRAAVASEGLPPEAYVPTAMFGAGAGLVLALPVYAAVVYAVAVRPRRPAGTPRAPGTASVSTRPGDRQHPVG